MTEGVIAAVIVGGFVLVGVLVLVMCCILACLAGRQAIADDMQEGGH